MNIYFTSNRTKAIKAHEIIVQWLKKEKHQVKSELSLKASQIVKINNFDLIILEVANINKAVYKIIFEALMQGKHVFLLYKYHSRRPKNLNFPLEKKILKRLTVKGYVLSHLPQILENFFSNLEKRPSERFNLFITKDIEEYLNWIPYAKAKTKSDFIRNLVMEQIKKDKKYNVHKKKIKKK